MVKVTEKQIIDINVINIITEIEAGLWGERLKDHLNKKETEPEFT